MFNKKAIKEATKEAIKEAENKYVCCDNCGVRIQKEKANMALKDKRRYIWDNDPAFKTIKENFDLRREDYDFPLFSVGLYIQYSYVAKAKIPYCLYCFENKIKKGRKKKK